MDEQTPNQPVVPQQPAPEPVKPAEQPQLQPAPQPTPEVKPEPSAPPSAEAPKPSAGHNTGMAVLAYILFFIPLLTDAKNDPFVKFHVKQGLVLFLANILVLIVA